MKKRTKNNGKIKNIIIFIIFIIMNIIVYVICAIKDNAPRKAIELNFSEITFNVPSEFEYRSYSSIKDYSYADNRAYCNFAIHSYKKEYYDDFEEWFKERIIINLTDKMSELKQIEINGKLLLNVNKENINEKSYYYGISSSNYHYFIEYQISDSMNGDREDINENLCYNSLDKILSTINVK